jgi:hypothetical protein
MADDLDDLASALAPGDNQAEWVRALAKGILRPGGFAAPDAAAGS